MPPAAPIRVSLIPILVILGVAVLAMAPAIFLGRVPAQTDWLPHYGPWGEKAWSADATKPVNRGGGDSFFVYLPDRLAAVAEWKSGRIPLWNPYVSAGLPFLGMQTANPLDPLIILELLLPTGNAQGLACALLMFVAAFGVMLLLKDRGLDSRAALVTGGIVFALSPYFVVWLEDRVFLAGFATLPLALWAMERLLQAHAPARLEASVLALALGYSLLGGNLQLFAILVAMLMVRLVWLLAARPAPFVASGANRWLLAVACVAGLMIGVLPLIAGVELLSHSTRLSSAGYYAADNFLSWRAPAHWFSPAIFGSLTDLDPVTPRALGRPHMSGSGWGALGVMPFGLMLFGLLRRGGPVRERLFWTGLWGTSLAFLFLQATPFHRFLIRLFPWPDDVDLLRGLLVVNLCGAILAGWGAAELANAWSRGTPRSRWLLPWLGYIGIGIIAILIGRSGLTTNRSIFQDLAPLVILTGSVLVVGLLPLRSPLWERGRIWFLLAIVAGELCWLHFKVNTFAPDTLTFPKHPMTTDLQQRLGSPDHARYLVLGRFRFLPPNTGSTYQLPDIRGYSPVPIARFRMLLECAEGRSDLENLTHTENFDSPIYRLLGASHVILGTKQAPPGYVPLWNRYLYRNPRALPRSFLSHDAVALDGQAAMRGALSAPDFDPGARVYLERTSGPVPTLLPPTGTESVRITSMEASRTVIEVVASSPGLLVVSDPYFPGWRAEVDGVETRIMPANWGLRAVAVAPGRHRVEFDYRPAWLIPGFVATLAGTLLALAGMIPRARRLGVDG